MIPIDGSTITVWVDGLPLGHPVYNYYRADIAALFPGYENSNGAVGVFTLDTTGYANGVHSIAWSVVDTAGHVDGIGSRFFTIQNAPGSPDAAEKVRPAVETASIRTEGRIPVYLKRGFEDGGPAEAVHPDADGWIRAGIPAVSRAVLHLNPPNSAETDDARTAQTLRIRAEDAVPSGAARYAAFRLSGNELRPSRPGRRLTPATGFSSGSPARASTGNSGSSSSTGCP